MAATLTAPLTNQDLDRALAAVANAIIEAAQLLDETVDYFNEALTQDNLDAGMLITLGGASWSAWTPAQFDQYRLFIGQTNDILQVLIGGSPPPIGVVQPWSAQFRP